MIPKWFVEIRKKLNKRITPDEMLEQWRQYQLEEMKREAISVAQKSVSDDGYYVRVKVPQDGKTPTREELLGLIRPLIPTDEDLLRLIRPLLPTDEQLVDMIFPLIPAPIKGDTGERGKRGEDGKTPSKTELLSLIQPLIPPPIAGRDGKDAPEMTGNEIAEKLNPLKAVLDFKVLKNVPEFGKGSSRKKTMARGISMPYYYDLSALCDGVTKTFVIPRNSKIIWVGGTDAPAGQYRQNTDYTGSGTTTLTLTSEVIAPSTGATLHLIYVE